MFKKGKKHGKGSYFYSNGDSYKGNWMDDKKNGEGQYNYNNNSSYTGNWVDG